MQNTGALACDFKFGEVQDMTSLAEVEIKYGYVVQSAGEKIFGIERTHTVGREEEKLRIGTPDGFVQMVVSLNQPNIDAVLHESTSVVVKHAGELRGASRSVLGGSALPRIRQEIVRNITQTPEQPFAKAP